MSDTRKINVDLGLVLNMEVPASMPDSEVLDLVFRASRGEGDDRLSWNLMANIGYYVGSQLESNLTNISISEDKGVFLSINGCKVCVKPQGDTRTPKQRSLDYNKADEFTEGES